MPQYLLPLGELGVRYPFFPGFFVDNASLGPQPVLWHLQFFGGQFN